MTEQSAPDTGATAPPDMGSTSSPDTGSPEADTGSETDWKSEAEKWQGLARKHEDQAKRNSEAAKELARVRREAMTDQEQAVAEAAAAAVAEVTGRLGGRLVLAEIRAGVGGRLEASQLDALVEHLDLSGFLTDDGDVDQAAVAAWVTRIAPESTQPPAFPDLGQGPRGPAATNGQNDPLLRDIKSKLGISV
jgi:hypothetical protein